MKSRVSLKKPNTYLFSHFLKQYKSALAEQDIGEFLNIEQIWQILVALDYINQEPNQLDDQLVKSIAWLLTQGLETYISRENLFRFLAVVSDIQGNSKDHFDSFRGVPNDQQHYLQAPMVPLSIGSFDQNFVWKYTSEEAKSIRGIFGSMNAQRMSRARVSNKNKASMEPLNESFRPNILPGSAKMAENRLKKLYIDVSSRVEDRLLLSRSRQKDKQSRQIAKSLQREMTQCTFKPNLISNNENSRVIEISQYESHPDKLISKGQQYSKRRLKLHSEYKKLNESVQLQECTFKPNLSKHKNNSRYVYVKNKDKTVERLKRGRKQREFVNLVKERGYPDGVSWNQYIHSQTSSSVEHSQPILCIDLRLLKQQHNIDVYEGQNLLSLAEKISRQNKIPKSSWWKVQDLIRKAIQSCPDVLIEDNRIKKN